MSHTVNVQVIRADESNDLPSYKTENAACMDLYAYIPNANYNEIIIPPKGGMELIDTGIKVNIPNGYEMQVRSRSGLAAKNKVFVLNAPGIIDVGYLDNIKVILMNLGDKAFVVKNGDRIAQLSLHQCSHVSWSEVDKFDDSIYNRGGGFGSTKGHDSL